MSNPAKQPKAAARKTKKNKKKNQPADQQNTKNNTSQKAQQNKPRGLDTKDRVLIAGVLGLIFGELFWDDLTATIITGALSAGLVMAAQMLVLRLLANKEAAAQAKSTTPAEPQTAAPDHSASPNNTSAQKTPQLAAEYSRTDNKETPPGTDNK